MWIGVKSVNSGHKAFEMIDWDSPSDLEELMDDDEFQAGVYWGCCEGDGHARGCKVREHLVRARRVARSSVGRYL